jgi:hypothetical protein
MFMFKNHGKIGDLKKLIANMSDDDIFVIPGPDHTYRHAKAHEDEILAYGSNDFHQWTGDVCDYGYENMQELNIDGGKIIKALIIE